LNPERWGSSCVEEKYEREKVCNKRKINNNNNNNNNNASKMLETNKIFDNHSIKSRHHGPGVDSFPDRNEYQEYFVGIKDGGYVGLSSLSFSCADCLET
jgi:hypothetical protein